MIAAQTINDMTISKLTPADSVIWGFLLRDVFPGVELGSGSAACGAGCLSCVVHTTSACTHCAASLGAIGPASIRCIRAAPAGVAAVCAACADGVAAVSSDLRNAPDSVAARERRQRMRAPVSTPQTPDLLMV